MTGMATVGSPVEEEGEEVAEGAMELGPEGTAADETKTAGDMEKARVVAEVQSTATRPTLTRAVTPLPLKPTTTLHTTERLSSNSSLLPWLAMVVSTVLACYLLLLLFHNNNNHSNSRPRLPSLNRWSTANNTPDRTTSRVLLCSMLLLLPLPLRPVPLPLPHHLPSRSGRWMD